MGSRDGVVHMFQYIALGISRDRIKCVAIFA